LVLVHASQKKFEKIKAFLFQFGLYRSLGLETFLHIFFCRSTLKQLVLGSKGRNRKKRTLNAKATDNIILSHASFEKRIVIFLLPHGSRGTMTWVNTRTNG